MNPFSVGDRVRCYFAFNDGVAVRNATIEEPGETKTKKGVPCVYVCLDRQLSGEFRYYVPLKAVRRLRKKEPRKPREWWVYREGPRSYWSCSQIEPGGEWREKFKAREITGESEV